MLAGFPLISDADRQRRNLSIALGVSLLFHAVVLSIHFKLPEKLGKVTEHALDVILVNSKSAQRPDQAQAKAQANLDGGGNTDEDRRAKTPLPVSAAVQEGSDLIEAQKRVSRLEAQQQQMLTQIQGDKPVTTDSRRNNNAPPGPPTASGTDLASAALNLARLEGQISRNMEDYNKRPRRKFVGTRTEEYVPAQYIEGWRNKIERIGNLNYPQAAKGKLYGSLLVFVEIRSNGEIERVEIQRSSGYKVLDEAALRIVRLAAPFGEFPPELKKSCDTLNFARTWTFTSADRVESE